MDERAKKTALRMIPKGVYVVTLRHGEERAGFTATWITQSSFKPPMLIIAVKADSRARSLAVPGAKVAIHFLRPDQQDLARAFFQPPIPSRAAFGDIAFREGDSGAPVLEDALAVLEGRVTGVISEGDHHPVLIEVIEAEIRGDAKPLILADTPWDYGG